MPPAPPMFSTTTCWPRISLIRCPIIRPSTSVGPPAANGIIIVIGLVVVRELSAGMPGFVLACAAVRDHAKAEAWLHAERITCPLVGPAEFPALADLAIECTPAGMLEGICRPMLEAGKSVMVLSV